MGGPQAGLAAGEPLPGERRLLLAQPQRTLWQRFQGSLFGCMLMGGERIGVPNRQDLKRLARLRLSEAEALHGAGFYDGAAYLAGYAIEMALKARICRVLGVADYPLAGPLKPAYAVHDLAQLVLLAGLKQRLDAAAPALSLKWSAARPWNPDRRYTSVGTCSAQESLGLLDAIRDPRDGILKWIAKYW